jgi:hypothetical protein
MGVSTKLRLGQYESAIEANFAGVSLRAGQKPIKGAGEKEHVTDPDTKMEREVHAWGQSAHEKIRLPLVATVTAGSGGIHQHFGLGGTAITQWLFDRRFKPGEDPQYRFVSATNNCAGTVLEALKAGGSEAFLAASRVRLACSPLMVQDYAKDLEVAIRLLNGRFNGALAKVPTADAPGPPVSPRASLMTVDQWDAGASPAARAQGTAVRSALVDVHAASDAGFATRMAALVGLANAIITSVMNLPSTGLPKLGTLCRQLVATLAAEGDPPFRDPVM